MKRIILLLLIAVPTCISAQKLKKVSEGKYEQTVYHVLKSDRSIKHGSYEVYSNKKLITSGFYKSGVKDSIWTEYSVWGDKISEGRYLQNEKVGPWEFYDYQGQKEQVYDYTKKEITYFKPLNPDAMSKVVNGSDTIAVHLDRPALYFGGFREIMKVLQNNIQYPQDAVEKEISGKVYISFCVDSEGKAYGHQVKKGFHPTCDEEALRVIRMIPNNWFPAIYEGNPVTTEMVVPVNFKID